MLVVSKQRFLPTTVNTLVLTKDDNYFYVHRDVYDQAVVLLDRFPTTEPLLNELGFETNNVIDWAWENLPKPINILAPYIGLVEDGLQENIEECCGVLHVISTVVNLRQFIKQPRELRKSVEFSLSIREEYEMAWESFFLSCIDYADRNTIKAAPQTISYTSNTSTPQIEVDPEDDGEAKYGPGWTRVAEGIYANMASGEQIDENDDLDAMMAEMLGTDDKEEEKESTSLPAYDYQPSSVASASELAETNKLLTYRPQ